MTRNEDPAERLEHLWRCGQKPDLVEFVASLGSPAPSDLARLARVDLRRRWRGGEHLPVEEYLRRLPALGLDPEIAVDLVFAEYLLREELGKTPTADEFARRFPKHAAVLRDQIALHGAFAAESAADNSRGDAVGPIDNAAPRQLITGDSLPEHFGRYRIIKPLGQGGMGSVYLAHDSQLRRQVALKVPRLGGGDDKFTARFYREARIAATFRHPNLCPIYDVGEIGGVPFLTMPYLTGESLATRLAGSGRMKPRDACRLALAIARAMEVAHRSGVRHRDLKPANIMLEDGMNPIVMDFGLARRSSLEETPVSTKGHILGTWAYMPPEQFLGTAADAEPTGDVYSLGVILFELLAGRLPFVGTRNDIMRAALRDAPPSLRDIASDVDPGLQTICEKALAKNPADRFQSMAEFADALEPFVADEAPSPPPSKVASQPPNLAGNRKYRILIRGVLLLAASSMAIWLATRRPEPAPDAAVADDPLPVKSVWTGEFEFANIKYRGDVEIVVAARSGRQFTGVYTTEKGAYQWRIAGTLRDGEIEWEFVDVVKETEPRQVVGNATVSGGMIGDVMTLTFRHKVYNSVAKMTLRRADPGQPAPRGNEPAAMKNNARAHPAQAADRLSGHEGPITVLAFHPTDSDLLFSGSQDGTIRLWDVAEKRSRAVWPHPSGWVLGLAIRADGRQLLSSGGSVPRLKFDVCAWDIAQGRVLKTLPGHSYLVSAVAFDPTGQWAASGAGDNSIRLWKDAQDDASTLFEGHTVWVHALAFHPKEKLLASGSGDETIRLWSVPDGKPLGVFKHDRPVLAIAFSPDGRFVASGGGEATIKIWNLSNGKVETSLHGHKGDVLSLAYDREGKTLASAGADGVVSLWNTANGARTTLPGDQRDRLNAVAFSPNGRTFAAAGADGIIRLWNLGPSE